MARAKEREGHSLLWTDTHHQDSGARGHADANGRLTCLAANSPRCEHAALEAIVENCILESRTAFNLLSPMLPTPALSLKGPHPLGSFGAPHPPTPSPLANSPSRLWHPGQLCTTSCAKTSHSMQNTRAHVSHSYRPLSLTFVSASPSLLLSLLPPPNVARAFCFARSAVVAGGALAMDFCGGAEGKGVRHPKQAGWSRWECEARAQETSFQLRRGKRW